MGEYFPKPISFGGKVKAELDLSNSSTKADLKNATSADISKYAKKVDLGSLKSEVDKLEKVLTGLNSLKNKVDKLDIEKLVPVPFNLSKLNGVVKKDVCNTKIKNSEDKIPDITNLATNTTLNPKTNGDKDKISSYYYCSYCC